MNVTIILQKCNDANLLNCYLFSHISFFELIDFLLK